MLAIGYNFAVDRAVGLPYDEDADIQEVAEAFREAGYQPDRIFTVDLRSGQVRSTFKLGVEFQ
jgi:hypothetical protein